MRMNMVDQGKIAALDNGPYLVMGEVLVTDAESNEFRFERKTRALCCCGESTTKLLRWDAGGGRGGLVPMIRDGLVVAQTTHYIVDRSTSGEGCMKNVALPTKEPYLSEARS